MSERTTADHLAHLREYWLNVRRIRFWLVLLLLVYTLAGFLGLPWLLRTTAIESVREDLGRDLRIAEIRTNPYALNLRIEGLEFVDRDGALLARFDRLLVDFTLMSLFNRAWTFESVELAGLEIHAERFESGETRIGRLLAELAPSAEPDGAAEPDETGPPRLVLEAVALTDGRLHFVDSFTEDTPEFTLDPVNIRIEKLDTRPHREGSQSVRIRLRDGGSLDWQGTLQMVPFRTAGRVELSGVVLDGLLPYIRRFAPIRDLDAVLDATFDYGVRLAAGEPELTVSNLGVALTGISVSAFEPELEFLAADALRVEAASYRHHERAIDIGAVTLERPHVRTWLGPDGRPGLLELLPDETPGDSGGAPAQSVALKVSSVRVNGLDVDLSDRSTTPPAPIALRDTNLRIEDVSLEPGAEFPTRVDGRLASGGGIAFNGNTRVKPAFELHGDLRVDGLDLALTQPYLSRAARARIESGSLDLDGRLAIGPREPLAYRGMTTVRGLEIVTAEGGEPVLGWESVSIDELDTALGARRVRTSLISIDGPFARIAIAADRSTNIGRLLVDAPAPDNAGGEPGEGAGEPFEVSLEGIAVTSGALDFADRSLPLPFSTRVQDLAGRISTLASGSTEPARVALEGQVGAYGLARIDGSINTWRPARHTDIDLEFRNLEMPDYSPYTVQFAGRRIAAGRMDLDLGYRIDEGRLEGSNDIVLRDLELGERVESPDAADLPLGLAVALLKDENGVIDVELPVSGNVDDPEFALGGVIRQALVTLIRKIVTSPFRFLGSLVGIESQDFGRIEFLAGRSDLTPPQREQIAKLVEALNQRPQLALELAGTHDPGIDRPALQRERALAALRARMEADGDEVEDLSLTDTRARETLRAMFREAYPETDLAAVRERFVSPPEDDPEAEPALDPVAFHAHLARRVVAAQPVAAADLRALAAARAQAIADALLAGGDDAGSGGGLDSGRVRVGDPQSVEAEGDKRIPVEIGLAPNG